MSHALGEAFEETSEELLADFSKSVLNGVRWLRNEKSLDMGQWSNMLDRYGMSALGGFFGGGLSSVSTSFSQSKHLASMDKTIALQELIYLVNNNQEQEFLKNLSKITLGSKNLSARNIVGKDSEGNNIYGEGTNNDNQDLELKRIVEQEVNTIRSILRAEGAIVSTESLLNKLT